MNVPMSHKMDKIIANIRVDSPQQWMITPIIRHESSNNYWYLARPFNAKRAIRCTLRTEGIDRISILYHIVYGACYEYFLYKAVKYDMPELIDVIYAPSSRGLPMRVIWELEKKPTSPCMDLLRPHIASSQP